MHSRTTATVATVAFLFALLVTNLVAQRQPTYLSHARDTVSKAHGLTPKALPSLGGVLSLADELTGLADAPISVRVVHDPSTEYPGYILVEHLPSQTQSQYHIDYASLVPIALFADSAAASLYTLYDTDPARANFMIDAGLLPHSSSGHVALEFAATPYATALYSLDTCAPDCLGDPILDTPSKLDVGDIPNVVPYLHTDAGLTSPEPYVLTVRNGVARVSGTIVRFDLANRRGEVEVISATKIDPTNANLTRAYFLFETIALFRAAKRDDPSAWDRFMAAISSEASIQAHPEPWELYTQSFCDAYPSKPNKPQGFDCTAK